jgi:NAD+ synthase (glutamine-hydrolysing)
VIDPDGTVLARAATFAEELLVCDVDTRRAVAARLDDPRLRRGEPSPRLAVSATLRRSRPRTAPRSARLAAPPPSPVASSGQACGPACADYVEKNGFGSVLLGLSGGVDSALVAALAARTLGPERGPGPVHADALQRRGDAHGRPLVAERLGIGFREQPIEDLRLAFHDVLPDTTGLAAENLQARIRGMLLMTLSNQHGYLVLTTGNKSETAVGYSTLYGDSAGGFAPIKDVPKTMVFALCRILNALDDRETIPVSIIDRPPSAELRDGQRDEDSLPPYAVLDPDHRRLRGGRPVAGGDRGRGTRRPRHRDPGGRADRPRRVQAPSGPARDQALRQGVRAGSAASRSRIATAATRRAPSTGHPERDGVHPARVGRAGRPSTTCRPPSRLAEQVRRSGRPGGPRRAPRPRRRRRPDRSPGPPRRT